jgi:uncharacterized protein YdhG (YjbR/CyaY superfamily)
MAQSGERSDYFPKIEAKHGKPVEHWFDQLGMLESDKYPEQIALLRNEHGFSQAHANAVVMVYRGSESSMRFADPDDYFENLATKHRELARQIFHAIRRNHPELELVIAWNQPMLRKGKDYIFGLSASTHHLSINPFTPVALHDLRDKLEGLDVLKHTIRIPLDWTVDEELLKALVSHRIAGLEEESRNNG